MALSDAYARADEYRVRRSQFDGGDDIAIDADLLLISRVLESKAGLNRFFNADEVDVARIFTTPSNSRGAPYGWADSENPYRYGNYYRRLYIDDLSAAPTSITIDTARNGTFVGGTSLSPTDYVLEPENALVGPEAQPYTAIAIPSWSSIGGFAAGDRVQIVGKWGWPAVPEAIKVATIELAGILRLESPRATRTVDMVGSVVGMSAEGTDILKKLLKAYAKKLPI